MKQFSELINERLKLTKDSKLQQDTTLKDICKKIYDFLNETISLGQLTKNEQYQLSNGDSEITHMIIKEMIDERKLNEFIIRNLSEDDNIFIRVFMVATTNCIRLGITSETLESILNMTEEAASKNHPIIKDIPKYIYKNYCLIK